MTVKVSMTVNGKKASHEVEERTLLVSYIRETLQLTGTHMGCDTAQCGACTIHLDGRAVKACNMLAMQAEGTDITTIEGLGSNGELHPVQRALIAEQAAQCGYCMSGIAVAAAALLASNRKPTEQQVREALDKHLCRCGSHNRVVRAVMRAAHE